MAMTIHSARRIQRGLVRRLKAVGHIGAPHQLLRIPANVAGGPTLLIVAPALVAVPPAGWGAVETVVWEQANEFANRGFDVTVLNSPRWSEWLRARIWQFPVVLVHYEPWLRRVFLLRRIFRFKVVACSHYGLLEYPSLWDRGYERLVARVLRADVILALNSRIADLLTERLSSATQVLIVPNGSEFRPKRRASPSRGALVLGKIETRKQQFELYQELKPSGIDVAFVGPIVDERVQHLLIVDPDATRAFLGPWDRAELAERLSAFSLLILNSKGEADALVLYEAQLAGVPVLLTSQGLGAQDVALPWIHLLADGDLAPQVQSAISRSAGMRASIVAFAESNYRWRTRLDPLVEAIRTITPGKPRSLR